MKQFDEQTFVCRICQQLDESLEEIDDAVVSRLDSAREQALRRTPTSPSELTRAARETLSMANTLAPEIESRLHDIRRRAVARMAEKSERPKPRQSWPWLARLLEERPRTAGMVTAGFVLATTVSLLLLDRPPDTLSLEEELVLLASAEDVELYENLDFYLWLAENGFPN